MHCYISNGGSTQAILLEARSRTNDQSVFFLVHATCHSIEDPPRASGCVVASNTDEIEHPGMRVDNVKLVGGRSPETLGDETRPGRLVNTHASKERKIKKKKKTRVWSLLVDDGRFGSQRLIEILPLATN